MFFNLNIPDDAVPFILFQRTAYLVIQNNIFWNRFLIRIPLLSYNRYVALEAFFGRNRIKRLFGKDISDEYERIKNYLPKHVANVLDIGCGIAGIDIFISRHYQHKPNIYLLDKTEIAKEVYYDLKPKAAFYNSLLVARQTLEKNGVLADKIHTEEVALNGKIKFDQTFDLVISLISWGFHYPVEIYLDQVFNLLNPHGTLIIDVRRNSGGEEAVRAKFGRVQKIYSAQKHDRLVATK